MGAGLEVPEMVHILAGVSMTTTGERWPPLQLIAKDGRDDTARQVSSEEGRTYVRLKQN